MNAGHQPAPQRAAAGSDPHQDQPNHQHGTLPSHVQTAWPLTDVIDRYTKTMKRPPRRLVVHKQSRFFPEEQDNTTIIPAQSVRTEQMSTDLSTSAS